MACIEESLLPAGHAKHFVVLAFPHTCGVIAILLCSFKRIAIEMCNQQIFGKNSVVNGIFERVAHCIMHVLTVSGHETLTGNNPQNMCSTHRFKQNYLQSRSSSDTHNCIVIHTMELKVFSETS